MSLPEWTAHPEPPRRGRRLLASRERCSRHVESKARIYPCHAQSGCAPRTRERKPVRVSVGGHRKTTGRNGRDPVIAGPAAESGPRCRRADRPANWSVNQRFQMLIATSNYNVLRQASDLPVGFPSPALRRSVREGRDPAMAGQQRDSCGGARNCRLRRKPLPIFPGAR